MHGSPTRSICRAVLFFFMLYTLGLDSEFALLETVLTGFYDTFPKTRRYKFWLTLAACVLCFLISIPCFSLSGTVSNPSQNLQYKCPCWAHKCLSS